MQVAGYQVRPSGKFVAQFLNKWQKTSGSEQNRERMRMREQRRKDEGTKRRTGKQEWKSRVGESTPS